MSLRTEVDRLLDHVVRLCGGNDRLQGLSTTAKEMQERLAEPLRVAVVGIMKAGKSTFMNALMGKDIVDTGSTETTYTVGWFRWGETPALEICFRDGRREKAPFEDLQKWSVRAAAQENDRLNDVQYVMIYYPSEVLKKLEFIDTPGLNSVYGTDAQNTLDFLSIQGHEDTVSEASRADAVIYAFSRSMAGFDKEILEAFHAGAARNSSPINSIGILTKVDATGIWDLFDEEIPVEKAGPVAAKSMENPEVRRLLFSIYPVCAKAVEGVAQLDETDWELLGRAAELDREELAELLYDAHLFCAAQSREDASYAESAEELPASGNGGAGNETTGAGEGVGSQTETASPVFGNDRARNESTGVGEGAGIQTEAPSPASGASAPGAGRADALLPDTGESVSSQAQRSYWAPGVAASETGGGGTASVSVPGVGGAGTNPEVSDESFDFDSFSFEEPDEEEEELQELTEALEELGTAVERTSVMSKLSQYGILEVTAQLAAGKTREEIAGILQERCGIQAVREILQSHFGNRTFLIKSQYIFGHLRSVLSSLKKEFPGDAAVYNVCTQIAGEIEELMMSVQTLDELKILQMYYNRQVRFRSEAEREDFLRVTGEYGRKAEIRLDLPDESTIADMRDRAGQKAAEWRARAGGFMLERSYVEAARTIARSYETMYYHLSALEEE